MCAATATLPTQTMRRHNAVFITNHAEAVIPGCSQSVVSCVSGCTTRPYTVKLSLRLMNAIEDARGGVEVQVHYSSPPH